VTVTIAPNSGATVDITNGTQHWLVSTSQILQFAPGSYSWEATAAGGFELVGALRGSFVNEDCTPRYGELAVSTRCLETTAQVVVTNTSETDDSRGVLVVIDETRHELGSLEPSESVAVTGPRGASYEVWTEDENLIAEGRLPVCERPTTTTTQPALGALGDFVWIDGNGNGQQDAGELPVPGATVRLYDGATGSLVATTTTDAAGKYLFGNLPAGKYVVEFVKPDFSGAVVDFTMFNVGPDVTDNDAAAVDGRTEVIILDAGEIDLTWDAGVVVSEVLGSSIAAPTTVAAPTNTPNTLPFTGNLWGGTALVGLGLAAAGFVVLGGARRKEEEAESVLTGWGSRI